MVKQAPKTEDQRRQQDLEAAIDTARLPRHIAIIMDGNGRWARKRGLASRVKGHEAGAEAGRTAVEACAELGIGALSLFAFWKENWKRPRQETSALMRFLKKFVIEERPNFQRNNIKLIASGSLDDLPKAPRDALDETMRLTAKNSGLILNLCLSYSGQEEIVDAVRAIVKNVQEGTLDIADITRETFPRFLYAPEIGQADLLIRTSGEYRISDFLLWEIALAEFYFSPVLWPDFTRLQLLEAIRDYQKRDRRYGGVSPTVA